MKLSLRKGFSFGLTSSIITTLGLITGLEAGTHSKLIVMGGILTIAIADSLSDALGIHVSEEAENKHSNKEIWESTIATVAAKFFFSITFLIPFLLMELNDGIITSIAYGLTILGILSYYMNKKKPWKAVTEHISLAIIVIIITHYAGQAINLIF